MRHVLASYDVNSSTNEGILENFRTRETHSELFTVVDQRQYFCCWTFSQLKQPICFFLFLSDWTTKTKDILNLWTQNFDIYNIDEVRLIFFPITE